MHGRLTAAWGGAAVLLVLPQRVAAHAFGARYDLPIPLGLWLAGAGAVVALSFVLALLFLRGGRHAPAAWRLDLMTMPLVRPIASTVLVAARAIAVALFVLIVAAGFIGTQTTTKNVAPVLVWVLWWIGMAYTVALFGDLWRAIDPWTTIFGWAERTFNADGRPLRPYPAWLDAWPAVAFFFIFAWLEIVSDSGEVPGRLAVLVLAYSAITWAGMSTFGRAVWRERAEAFSVCFGLLGRFGITEGGRAPNTDRPAWRLRAPGVGLLADRPLSPALVVFTLLLLATVSFDGIAETPLWAAILDGIAESQWLRPLLVALQDTGVNLVKLVRTLGLVATVAIFLCVYLLFCRACGRAGGGGLGLWTVAGWFVLSLVPIAIAYHLSHYFSYLLLAGQLAIPLASDPFGWGWDLFGTARYAMDISVVSAKMVWYLATVAVVAGHVFAVYLGHVTALRVFPDARRAHASQVPLLILMVAYTMLSLWILAQPIVEAG